MPRAKKLADGPCRLALKPLACPYWKLDPVRFRCCAKLDKFREIKQVKQHLHRSHSDIYCEKCKVTFGDEGEHEQHLRHSPRECVFTPWVTGVHTITNSQKTQLSKKSAATTVSEQ
ncbi:hypothetical protein C8A05DRAFT_17861 [Staphylotrichum tortipilum]|uniref:C2H2-type domain-containing protein n=1 Tax=Staphylotrichum tortipilum TaxID=2831512 RepID=A0AAN6MGM5_9PEZI|nr:hypothetical protein C8A05DRAFT_17861 [Staphylotrichum longicolle]